MNKEVLEFAVGKTHELMNAVTCSQEAKDAARIWLDAVGTEQEAAETGKYVEALEAVIMPIDNLIAFAGSDAGMQYFGADTAKNIVAHACEIKAAGAQYCDCPACAAVEAILKRKDELL